METTFEEPHLSTRPIRDLGLRIEGTALAPVVEEFGRELERADIRRVRPRFYLSSEWGVPFGTVAIAIPFYLAHPELTRLHAERTGHVEGMGRASAAATSATCPAGMPRSTPTRTGRRPSACG